MRCSDSCPGLISRCALVLIALLRVSCFVHARLYLMSSFNRFDCVVVLTSLVDIIMDFFANGVNTPGLGALRSLRLLRVFRLARTWKDLQARIVFVVLSSLVDSARSC